MITCLNTVSHNDTVQLAVEQAENHGGFQAGSPSLSTQLGSWVTLLITLSAFGRVAQTTRPFFIYMASRLCYNTYTLNRTAKL